MSYQVKKSKKSDAVNRFEFEQEIEVDGEVKVQKFSVAHLKYAPTGAVEHFEQGRTVTGLIMCADDEPTRDLIRSFDSEQLSDFLDAWKAASQVSPGESPASE
jgi:hypothetical protein